MFNTPNIVGLIKAAAGEADSSSEIMGYQAPEGGPLHERIFGAWRNGDHATVRSLAPHIYESRDAATPDDSSSEIMGYQPPPEGALHERVFNAVRNGDHATARALVPHVYEDRAAAAAAADDSSSEIMGYQPPPGGSLPERVFGALRKGDHATVRSLVPHVYADRDAAAARRAASRQALTLGGTMPTFKSNVDTSVQGAIPSPEQHRANQQAAGLDENGMPLQLDPPEAIAESNELLRKIQADNAAPAASPAPTSPQNTRATASAGNATTRGGRTPRTSTPARSSRPASPATPNAHAFRNITAADMRKYRRYTGASSMNSEMDKWKTWQAMQGRRNVSNADFYAARSNGFR